jgi:hypothetical protein
MKLCGSLAIGSCNHPACIARRLLNNMLAPVTPSTTPNVRII